VRGVARRRQRVDGRTRPGEAGGPAVRTAHRHRQPGATVRWQPTRPRERSTPVRLALLDHHLANFHADTFHRLLGSTFADRGVEVVAAFESDPTPGTDWCADHAVARTTSLDEAVDRADALLVLAPDDLDTHLDTARRVLPAGKPVVFDKLLALDPAEAWQIVALAEQHGTRIFSGSALRYAAEADRLLDGVDPVRIQDAFARGYGAWDHYGIHTLSLAVRLGGHHITRM